MLSKTFDPLNPAHRAALLAAAGIGAALAVWLADAVFPALVAGAL